MRIKMTLAEEDTKEDDIGEATNEATNDNRYKVSLWKQTLEGWVSIAGSISWFD